jgi:hypothetical protein
MTLQFSRVALLVALSVTIYTVMKTFQSLRATDTWSEQGSQFYHGFFYRDHGKIVSFVV